jgi:hypothetical protein
MIEDSNSHLTPCGPCANVLCSQYGCIKKKQNQEATWNTPDISWFPVVYPRKGQGLPPPPRVLPNIDNLPTADEITNTANFIQFFINQNMQLSEEIGALKLQLEKLKEENSSLRDSLGDLLKKRYSTGV